MRRGPKRLFPKLATSVKKALQRERFAIMSEGAALRFDDSLKTVLAADASTAFGAQATFRQLADLMARGRVPADGEAIARLRDLRGKVPVEVRAAVARGLALGRPPLALVACFADDEPAVASAALRAACLPAADWVALVARLGPTGRAVLRRRNDLDPVVIRALETFGPTDFALGYDAPPPVDRPVAPAMGPSPFTPVGALTDALPVVAAARRAAQEAPQTPRPGGGFEIAELVDRIANFQRTRGRPAPAVPAEQRSFRFEASSDGTIRWTDAMPRGAIIGVTLARTGGAAVQVDGVAAGAFRRRTAFGDARLQIAGEAPLAGEWRISGVPLFDPASGRFTGYRGAARRPRADETAVRATDPRRSEGLRRLVHELRTPTNAIAGFSELIEAQLLGPVPDAYRARAAAIRTQANDLIAAIEDLDLAARIEGDALELRPGEVPLAALLGRISGELAALAGLRGATLSVPKIDDRLSLACDERAVERLLARLLATIVSAAQPGETIAVTAAFEERGSAAIAIDRPRALAALPDAALLNLDAEREADLPGAPLLGTGFALRLARNLAVELGGSLSIGAGRLTLVLPAAAPPCMEQASIS